MVETKVLVKKYQHKENEFVKYISISPVPAAAPLAPNPQLNMKKGSKQAFSAVNIMEYFKGVLVSPTYTQ